MNVIIFLEYNFFPVHPYQLFMTWHARMWITEHLMAWSAETIVSHLELPVKTLKARSECWIQNTKSIVSHPELIPKSSSDVVISLTNYNLLALHVQFIHLQFGYSLKMWLVINCLETGSLIGGIQMMNSLRAQKQ